MTRPTRWVESHAAWPYTDSKLPKRPRRTHRSTRYERDVTIRSGRRKAVQTPVRLSVREPPRARLERARRRRRSTTLAPCQASRPHGRRGRRWTPTLPPLRPARGRDASATRSPTSRTRKVPPGCLSTWLSPHGAAVLDGLICAPVLAAADSAAETVVRDVLARPTRVAALASGNARITARP